MRLFFAAGHYEKAITVSETIQELYYNRLDEKDIEECLLIFDELKLYSKVVPKIILRQKTRDRFHRQTNNKKSQSNLTYF